MKKLFEDNRSQLLSRSKSSEKEKGDGKTRYEKRVKSKFANSVKQFNQIDMNELFKDNILTINIPVIGETDNYIVTISFGGFLDYLREQIERNKGKFDLRTVIQALVNSFNRGDVYTRCSCPDWWYRQSFWSSQDKIAYGPPQDIPSPITNPDDTMGGSCKHIALCLSNSGWVIKVASVINNYVKYMERHYQKAYQTVIYPAIYGKEYEGDVQLDIYDDGNLDAGTETIDTANIEGEKSGQFKQGNKYRFKKREPEDEDQLTIEDEQTITER